MGVALAPGGFPEARSSRQLPGIRLRTEGRKPARVDPWLIHRLLLPPPWLQSPRAQMAGRTLPLDAGGSVAAPVPEKAGPPSSDTCFFLPYPAASHTCWADLSTAAVLGTVKASGQIRAHSGCAVRKKSGECTMAEPGHFKPFSGFAPTPFYKHLLSGVQLIQKPR